MDINWVTPMLIKLVINLLLDALSDGLMAAHLAISERCVNTMTHIWRILYCHFNPTGGPRGCAHSTTRQRAQLTHSRRVTGRTLARWHFRTCPTPTFLFKIYENYSSGCTVTTTCGRPPACSRS